MKNSSRKRRFRTNKSKRCLINVVSGGKTFLNCFWNFIWLCPHFGRIFREILSKLLWITLNFKFIRSKNSKNLELYSNFMDWKFIIIKNNFPRKKNESRRESRRYNPIQDFQQDFWRDSLAPKVSPRVSLRVSPRLSLRLSVRLLAPLLVRLFASKSLVDVFGLDYMHDSRRDSLRDSFFLPVQKIQRFFQIILNSCFFFKLL